jgi:hypothetical protein
LGGKSIGPVVPILHDLEMGTGLVASKELLVFAQFFYALTQRMLG